MVVFVFFMELFWPFADGRKSHRPLKWIIFFNFFFFWSLVGSTKNRSMFQVVYTHSLFISFSEKQKVMFQHTKQEQAKQFSRSTWPVGCLSVGTWPVFVCLFVFCIQIDSVMEKKQKLKVKRISQLTQVTNKQILIDRLIDEFVVWSENKLWISYWFSTNKSFKLLFVSRLLFNHSHYFLSGT